MYKSSFRTEFFAVCLISSLFITNFNCQNVVTLLGVEIEYAFGENSTDFILRAPLNNVLVDGNAWIGLGFNSIDQQTNKMDQASVVVCKSSPVDYTVEHYHNDGYSPSLIDLNDTTIGISNSVIAFNDVNMTCSFTRDNYNQNPKYFNVLKSDPYFLIAYGNLKNLSISYHQGNRQRSDNTISLSGNGTSTQTTIATTEMPTTTRAPPNGIAYGSFQSGDFQANWTDYQNITSFVLTTKVSDSTDIYTAIGFSYDREMGNDGVVYCNYSSTGGSTIVQAYNSVRVRPSTLDSNNPSVGLSNMAVKLVDGKLECSFDRIKVLSNITHYFNLNNQYYLLFAKGKVSQGLIQYHDDNKLASIDLIDFHKNSTVSQANLKYKVKLHGCVMVIIWMFVASTGILFARYYKFIFPTIKWFNLQFWFNIHRPFMVSVPILSIAAFLVIFSDLNWKWVDQGVTLNFFHSIFGILTIALSIAQIPIAMVRPKPNHPKRSLFNYVHKRVGLSAFLFSIITLFLGVLLPRVSLGKTGWSLMVAWTVWVFILPLAIDLSQILLDNKTAKILSMPNPSYQFNKILTADASQVQDDSDDDSSALIKKGNLKKIENIKSFLLVAHLLVAFSLTISLVTVISISDGHIFN